MNKEEEKDFLEKAANDPELKMELQAQQDLNNYLEIKSERDKFKIQVKDILAHRNQKPVIRLKKYYPVAASIIVLVSLSVLAFIFTPDKNERLFNKYYETYQFSSIERSSTEVAANNSEKAYSTYSNEKYTEFIQLVEKDMLLESEPFMMQLLYASALMETDQVQKAIPVLEEMYVKENLYVETVKWYLALSYLKTGDQEKAKKLLQEISKNDSFYAKNANLIQKKLK